MTSKFDVAICDFKFSYTVSVSWVSLFLCCVAQLCFNLVASALRGVAPDPTYFFLVIYDETKK